MKATARILLADPDPPTRAEIRHAIERDGAFRVCAEAGDAAGAVSAALDHRPHLCVLDVRLPGNGISAAWEITSRLPESKVVMLTVSEDDADLFGALRAGVAGYLLKDIDPRRLPRALHSVLAGEMALPRELVGRVVAEFQDRSARRRALVGDDTGSRLTSREWQVLDLLRRDFTTTQIAQRLVLSPVTVRTHVGAILKKLHVDTRDELLRELAER